MSAKRKTILVFQHLDVEHPGVFRDFLAADGFERDAQGWILLIEDWEEIGVVFGHSFRRYFREALHRALGDLGRQFGGIDIDGDQLLNSAETLIRCNG